MGVVKRAFYTVVVIMKLEFIISFMLILRTD